MIRNEGGFAGFTGYVGTEEIDRSPTRDWLTAFGARHAGVSLANYAAALGRELTALWKSLGLHSGAGDPHQQSGEQPGALLVRAE